MEALLRPENRAQALQAAQFAVEAGLICVVAILLARMIWTGIEGPSAVTKVTPFSSLPTTATVEQNAIRVDTSVLVNQNPFGRDLPTAELSEVDAPETNLNLTLKGIRAVTGDVTGSAIIRTSDNREGSFSVGDKVMDGVTVERILSDRVVLKRNGKLESLYLRDRGGLSAITGGEPRQQLESLETYTPPTRGVVSDGRALWSSIRINAVVENDRTVGYRLTPRGSSELMTNAGLVPGDVIVGYDGRSVAQMQAAEIAAAFTEIQDQIELDIKRGDQSLALTIEFGGDN